MTGKLVQLFLILSVLHLSHGTKSCYSYVHKSFNTCTGWWGWHHCKYVNRPVKVCCKHYSGVTCNIPSCRMGNGTDTCNIQNAGYVRHKDGRIVRNSGGTCKAPGTCIYCNKGYYPATTQLGYCKACYRPPHCNLPRCTTAYDSRCDYCEEEYDRYKPGYNVYSGKQCQRACSWKSGARCFPGSCTGDMILNSDCQCARGFESKFSDCATANSDKLPTIKMSFNLTDSRNEFKRVEKSLNETIFWTRQTDWSQIAVKVFTSYKPEIEYSKMPNYITNYNIGIESLDIGLTLTRGTGVGKWTIAGGSTNFNENCHKDIHYPLENIVSWKNILAGGRFQHKDKIKFEVSAKNGGKIFYEDRGTFTKSYQQKHYFIKGVTANEVLELGFDTLPPKHCFEQSKNCQRDALKVADFLTEPKFKANWDGWSDLVSGIDVYEIEIYSLKKSQKDNLLKRKNMVTTKTVSSSESSTTLQLEEPGPYSVELIVHDNAQNYKIARRIILFDNASVVDLYGKKARVIQAQRTGWINKQSGRIEIIWTNRFRNIRHSKGGWLNGVKENENVIGDLDDTEGRSRRTVDQLFNIEGIVRFEIAREVEVNGTSSYSSFEQVPGHFFKLEKMVYADEEFIDGKKITYIIRGIDAFGKFAEDNATVKIDLSPPVLRNIWLNKGYSMNFRVHGVHERTKVTIEFEAFDYHSGIQDVSWKIFDNSTEILRGQSNVKPQRKQECMKSTSNNVREPECYCSPYDGCFNKHFQFQKKVSKDNFFRLINGVESGEDGFDYFVEVAVTNNAGLTTVHEKKVIF